MGVVEKLSKRQLLTIAGYGKESCRVHYGPYGCGKTYSLNLGLGYKCKKYKPPGGNNVIALVGKTAKTVEANICNGLTELFGDKFYYTKSKTDGIMKDAMLYGHYLRIIGMNDGNSEERIRGLNAYHILVDEGSTLKSDQFMKLEGRLRGKKPVGWEYGIEVSTNPDSPKHWLKQLIDDKESGVTSVHWTEHDNITSGAVEYYNRLKRRYKGNESLYNRYVLGEWTAADGLVYGSFSEKEHCMEASELIGAVYKYYKIGVDWGTSNPTAIVLVGVMPEGEHVVIREIYQSGMLITEIGKKIINIVNQCSGKCKGIYVDPSAAALIKQLENDGLGTKVKKANNDVIPGIDYVRDMFNSDKLIISKECKNLIDELYTYSFSSEEKQTVVKTHDHACDALRYVLYTDFSRR